MLFAYHIYMLTVYICKMCYFFVTIFNSINNQLYFFFLIDYIKIYVEQPLIILMGIALVAIIPLILTVSTIINSIICHKNFGKGLKIYCK
jgi:hypothetical protein